MSAEISAENGPNVSERARTRRSAEGWTVLALLTVLVALSLGLGMGCESADAASGGGIGGSPAQPADAAIDAAAEGGKAEPRYADWGDPFENLPKGDEQLALVCGRGEANHIHRVFCAEQPPEIKSLSDLQNALGLDPTMLRGPGGSALTGHSTSLSRRSTSAINPRVITFRALIDLSPSNVPFSAQLASLAFSRGEQFVELAVMGGDREYRFYVVHFEQECNERPEGCAPGELLTEAIEHNWRNVSLYDEQSLQNTVLDCATCHQPNGPDTPRMLRMQEFDDPWTHWFFNATPGGRALVEDYTAAKGDETVAGLLREDIGGISPGGLETVVGGRDHHQPNKFDSENIEKEIAESAAAEGGNQPTDNRVRGQSPTWRIAYENSKRGEFIPAPYHNVKVTDPDKLERMTDAYQQYRRGELSVMDLPDLRDIFPDDPAVLAELGIGTEPGLSGEEVLIQACSQCHNERLNQDQSRARFRADLVGISRDEKEAAIARLMLPTNSVYAMPPARLRVLSQEARERAIEALRK